MWKIHPGSRNCWRCLLPPTAAPKCYKLELLVHGSRNTAENNERKGKGGHQRHPHQLNGSNVSKNYAYFILSPFLDNNKFHIVSQLPPIIDPLNYSSSNYFFESNEMVLALLYTMVSCLCFHHRFNLAELAFLTEYAVAMSPVAQATNILQAEANAMMGWLLPTINLLTIKLDSQVATKVLQASGGCFTGNFYSCIYFLLS